MKTTAERRSTLLIVLALTLASVLVFVRFRHWAFDDAFIVFRYAQNILLGRGWIFNVNENYNASTSVLNTVLVTLLTLITGQPLGSSVFLGVLSLWITSLITFDFLKRLTNPWLAGFFSFAMIWLMARWYVFGLETLPFIALVMIFLALVERKKETGSVLGLIFLTRPDGALLALMKWAKDIYETKKLPLKSWLLLAVVVLPWFIFSFLKFHQLLPSTLGEKMWQGRSGFWGHGNVYWDGLKHSMTTLFGSWGDWGGVFAPFGLYGFYRIFKMRSTFLYFLVFAIAQQLFYVILNVPGYHWYFAPVHTIILISVFIGMIAAFEWLKSKATLVRENDAKISAAALSVLALSMIWSYRVHWAAPEGDDRLRLYTAVSDFVKAKYPGRSLASLEVGTFAYLTDSPMVDITGLTSPEPEFLTSANMDRFYELSPDILILHEKHGMEKSIMTDPRFPERYELLKEQPAPSLFLYARKGLAQK